MSGNQINDSAIVTLAGLTISKTAQDVNGGLLEVGDLIRYTVTITNDTAAQMTGVVVTDTLPPGVDFVDATPGGYSGPNPLVWNVGPLGVGATWTAVITVEVDGTADPIGGNVVAVRSDQQDQQETDPILPPEGGDVIGLLLDKTAQDVDGPPLYVGDLIRAGFGQDSYFPVWLSAFMPVVFTVVLFWAACRFHAHWRAEGL